MATQAKKATKSRIQTKNTRVFHGSNDYKFTDMVNHAGKVINFVMDDKGHIFYTVLNLDSATNQIDQKAWTPMDALPFPKELSQVGYGIVDNYQMPKRDGHKNVLTKEQIKRKYPHDKFNSSTGILGAVSQFHVYSF